jgi:hypothetical protein
MFFVLLVAMTRMLSLVHWRLLSSVYRKLADAMMPLWGMVVPSPDDGALVRTVRAIFVFVVWPLSFIRLGNTVITCLLSTGLMVIANVLMKVRLLPALTQLLLGSWGMFTDKGADLGLGLLGAPSLLLLVALSWLRSGLLVVALPPSSLPTLPRLPPSKMLAWV